MQTRLLAALVLGAFACRAQAAKAEQVQPYEVSGDSIPEPLAGRVGDPARGRAIVLDRRSGNCLICHQVPVPQELFQGDLGPSLVGVGDRLSAGQIRLRLVDASRINPSTLMPPYHRTSGLRHVPERYRGIPVLGAQDIEDVVAWLGSLRETSRGQR